MTTDASPGQVFLDTNVLLTASVPARPHHARALAVLDEWPGRGVQLCASGQVLREYLVVATRPTEVNGLGIDAVSAVANATAFRQRLRLLEEDERVADRLREILLRIPCRGKRIHDGNIVATMLVHRVRRLLTTDPDDFARFSDHVDVLGWPAMLES